jgi:phosphoribosylaminoimidazolecarboxamide formyltransferase/IMP cyclohydrolase
MDGVVPIRRALLSVSDKQGLIELAAALSRQEVELLASGGTHRALGDAGLAVLEVAAYTGQPQILGGRVKTLHPKIHGGILARRDVPEDSAALEAHGIAPIDLVVVNLYPFEATVARAETTYDDAIENIDIGGPTLIRAAAKNHAHVAVVTHPGQYEALIAEVERLGGTSAATRSRLARAAFALTSRYDTAISSYLDTVGAFVEEDRTFPSRLVLEFDKISALRYGENPHQSAALYRERRASGVNLATARILHGKELSYNNILDLDSAVRLVRLFDEPAAVMLKHNNPCGAAEAATIAEAFERAYEGDPVSAFGGIVGLNRPVDLATAERMAEPGRFLECIVAPGFTTEAVELLTTKPTWKKSVRLIDVQAPLGPTSPAPAGFDVRRIEGGLLVQDWDTLQPEPGVLRSVTRRPPSDAEKRDLAFAWRVCAAVKSNAIVVAKDRQVIGVGAGQMSRLDSVKIAIEKAGNRARGAVLASDAFFPFRDGPDIAAAAGVRAIIQPGGSKRDSETIDACNEHDIAMVFTDRRHFRH